MNSKRKLLLFALLMALGVPLAAWAQSAYQFGPGQNHFYSDDFSSYNYWSTQFAPERNGCKEIWKNCTPPSTYGTDWSAHGSCLVVGNSLDYKMEYCDGVEGQALDNYTPRVVYAYRKFYLPKGEYKLDFDYAAGGHGFSWGAKHAYLSVFLVPEDSSLPDDREFYWNNTPEGWKTIESHLTNLGDGAWATWQHSASQPIYIDVSGNYKLVFAWYNSTYYQNSMVRTGMACAIDNVVLRAVRYFDAPQGLTATNITTNSAQLQWDAMTGSPFCYRLEYCNWDSSPSNWSSVELATTSWNLSNLVAGRHLARVMAKYRYTIGNNIYYAETNWGEDCSFTINPPTLPKPNGLTQTSISDHSISFYWTTYGQYVPMGYNLVNQEIKYTNTTTNSSQTIVHTNISDYSQLIDDLAPATTYSIQVRGKYTRDGAASTSFWYSEWSNPLVATTHALTLPKPYNLTLYSISDNHLTFSWSVDDGTVPTDYSLVCQEIQYTNTNTNYSQTIEYTDTFANSERIEGLYSYTTYSVKVRGKYTRTGAASNSFWYSNWSDPLEATTLLVKPINVRVEEKGTSWAKIAWDYNSDYYQLPEGKNLAYAYQLGYVVPNPTIPGMTTIDWGEQVSGLTNKNVTLPMIPVGNCMIRLWAHLADYSSSTVAYSDYGGMQLFDFVITGPQNAITSSDFPYTVDFDDFSLSDNKYYFHDSLTVSGATQSLRIYGRDFYAGNYGLRYDGYNTSGNEETCVMLPKVVPGTGSDTWLKFEFYHDRWENALTNVVVDYSTDNTTWQQIGSPVYAEATESGWKYYSRILPKTDEEIWVRFRFTGTGVIRMDNLSINTDCGDYIITVSEPYTEGFENVAHSACWQGEGWSLSQNNGYSGKCAYNDDQTSELLSPGFSFIGCFNASISFYAKGSAGAALKVYYGTNYANSEIIPLEGISSSWKEYEIQLSQYITDMVKVAFVPDANDPNLRVDEITVSGTLLPDITVWLNDGGWGSTVYAEFEWYHSNITLAEGQSILYDCSMGTISGEEVTWTDMGSGTNTYSYSYLPVGNYNFRVRMRIVDGNTTIATGEWYEIYEPFPIVAANPVNNYPFTFGFEGGASDPLEGLNVSGTLEDVNRFDIGTEATTGIAPHGEGSSYLCFHHDGNESHEASVVLPQFYSNSAIPLAVSFWLYNNSGSSSSVVLEHSSDGENWTVGSTIYGNACNNAWHRFVSKINLVGEDPITPHVYVRLRFVSDETHPEQYFCLDDISVQPLENYKPYIYNATSTANSVTLSVIDNAYENGIGSKEYHVSCRFKDASTWLKQTTFTMEAPFTQTVELTVNDLEPNTTYDFRVWSEIPTGVGNATIWSDNSNIVSKMTDDGPFFIVSPGHPYEFGFEWDARGWTVPEGWDTYYEGGHESGHCAHASAKNKKLYSPEISFHESCDNVIIRFWAKGTGQSSPSCLVYSSDDGFATPVRIGNLPDLSADTWTEYVFPLCQFMSSGSVKIAFTWMNFDPNFSIDDIEIVANAYDKVLYKAGNTYNWIAENFCPQGLPDYSDNVLVCTSMFMNQNLGMADNIEFGTFGKLNVLSGKTLAVNNTLTAKHADALQVSGTVITGVLVPQAEGSVKVNDGGVIHAVEIAGEDYTASPNLVINDGGQVHCSNPFFGTYYKNITGYGAENVNKSTGWNLIAPLESGVAVSMGLVPMNGEEYVIEQMDLYEFEQRAVLEWVNKKNAYYNNGNDVRYLIVEPKEGYLYARQDDGTLEFKAIAGDNIFRATTTDVVVDEMVYFTYCDFPGWNLIGNPYTANAYVKDAEGNYMAYYRMNDTGDRIVVAEPGTPIKPCEGVFVQVSDNANGAQVVGPGSGTPVTFTTTAPNSGRGAIDFTLSKQSSTRDGVSASSTPIDRARISFSQGKGMGHLDLMADANRLYIPQGGKDMAVVCSEPAGEMPLNFEAAENGTYTLGISLNYTELVYCHLIDNLTGADVDLIPLCKGGQGDSTPATYTFEAKTTDYRSRFKVVFVAKSAFEGDNASNFAFHNGSAWVINASADATVQVIDMTGRVVVSTDVARGVSTNGIAPGVYVMRLIDGNDVKTQKIVVD
ncbi:MAG: fibronectin type III domain-containing protein [Bacteroidales bacterium]|nr:fibronectin type III domain-containing protein [Bacteroidales bacterium]